MQYDEINIDDRASVRRWVTERLGITVFCRTRELADALNVTPWTINKDVDKGLLKPRVSRRKVGYYTFSVENIVSYLMTVPERLKTPKRFELRYTPDFDSKVLHVIGTKFYDFGKWYGTEDLKQEVLFRMSQKAVAAKNEWIAIQRVLIRIYRENEVAFRDRHMDNRMCMR